MSDSPTDKAFSKRNHLAIIAERATGSVAHDLLAPGLVLAALVDDLGGGAMTIGALQSLLVVSGLSQLATAWYMERPASRRRYVLRIAGASLVVLPLLALALWAFAAERPGLMLWGLLLLLPLRWLLGSMCNPALLDLSRRLVDETDRPRVFAFRQLAAAACGMAAGGLTYFVLREFDFPAKYALVVLTAALLSVLAWVSVFLMRETPPRPAGERLTSPREFLRRLFVLLRPGSGGAEERHFRAYVAVRHAIFLSRCAYPFVTLYALTRFGVHSKAVALFVVALWAGRLSGGLLLSPVRRLRETPQGIARIAVTCTLFGLAAALLTPRWEGLLATFFLQGVFFEAYLVADPIFMMDHAPPRHEVLGMSLTMVALYPMNSVLPLVAGALFTGVGFEAVIGLAAVGGVAAFVTVGRLRSRAEVTPQDATEDWHTHE